MPDFTIIPTTAHEDIARNLLELAKNGAHFTGGTYAYHPRDMVLPTTLAGFKYISSIEPNLPFVVAINSDTSMTAIGKDGFEPQLVRSYKIAAYLAEHFPERKIIIIFFDETTPTELYQKLSQYGLTETLHKWGYGTSPSDPKIEGAECFQHVFAFPLPGDSRPVCYDVTAKSSSPQEITVVDLRGKLISADRRLLFDVPVKLPRPILLSPARAWKKAVEYIEAEKIRAISAGNSSGERYCQGQLDRLGGLVPYRP